MFIGYDMPMPAAPAELAPGLYRWTVRHPEWHPGEFGAEVAAFAVQAAPDHLVVVDPILSDDPGPVWELLDGLAGDRVTVAVTIPYHARDSEQVWRRYRERGARIVGHRAVTRRLEDASGFEELAPDAGDPHLRAFGIGRPRRNELPLHLPSHDAIAFGDALVTTPAGDLRIWHHEPVDAGRRRFYAERFAPTLEPLIALDPQRILVTHGAPILERGREALEAAIAAGPWYHRG